MLESFASIGRFDLVNIKALHFLILYATCRPAVGCYCQCPPDPLQKPELRVVRRQHGVAIVDTGPPGPVTRHGQGHQLADSRNITVMPQQSVQRRGPHSDGEPELF